MESSVVYQLTVQFSDNEVGTFLSILEKLMAEKGTIGFKKNLDLDEQELVEEMYVKFVGNEKDTSKDNQE